MKSDKKHGHVAKILKNKNKNYFTVTIHDSRRLSQIHTILIKGDSILTN